MIYCINVLKKGYNTAENKAPADVYEISKAAGLKEIVFYEPKTFKIKLLSKVFDRITMVNNWGRLFVKVKRNDIVLVQHPYEGAFIASIFVDLCKKIKKIKFVGLVHDLGIIRGLLAGNQTEKQSKRYYILDMVLLKKFDYIIAHNPSMIKYLIKKGYDKKRLYNLEIFDYLHKVPLREVRSKKKSVIVAGNLSPAKCEYVYKIIDGKNLGFDLELYGPNFQKGTESNNVNYHGVCTPEELPGKLEGSFGLVWDGNSIDKCAGNAGEYIRYNNPHKCSLFLSSNIPVIIWEKAALADFVVKNGVGFTVKSLSEISDKIDNLSEDDYRQMVANTIKIGEKLRQGYYLKKAIDQIEMIK